MTVTNAVLSIENKAADDAEKADCERVRNTAQVAKKFERMEKVEHTAQKKVERVAEYSCRKKVGAGRKSV